MPKTRIQAIDIFRGIAILVMIIAHTSEYWLVPEYKWFHAIFLIFADVMGANAFIFAAGLSMAMQYQEQTQKVKKNVQYTHGQARSYMFVRTFWIIGLAFLLNFIGAVAIGAEIELWIWYVLQTIAFARLACYPFLQKSPYTRLMIGIFFILFTDLISTNLGKISAELYYIFFNRTDLNGPFPFFGFFFIGSAFGDWVSTWSQNNFDLNKLPAVLGPNKLKAMGLCLIVFGMITGLSLNTDRAAQVLLTFLNYNTIWITALPAFLARNTTSWSIFSLGWEFLWLGLLIQRDFKRSLLPEKRHFYSRHDDKRPYIEGLAVLGQPSLTIYFVHYLVYFIFHDALTLGAYFIALGITLIIFYVGFWIWMNPGQAKGTAEWIIQYSSNFIVRIFRRKRLLDQTIVIKPIDNSS